MKQKDKVLIIVVIFVSAVVSFVGASIIFPVKNRQAKVEVVEKLSSVFQQPDPKFYNNNSLDPTRVISIGNNINTTPFNGNSNR
ncbi:MAG: hypothetical protein NVS1B7_2630 [Candidatus Saccharimonadales bacterium]